MVSSLYEEAGGSLGAHSASELPQDRRQVYDARQIVGCSSQSSGRADPCFDLIKQCKEDSLPSGQKFVRSVSIDSGLCCVLGSESHDVASFLLDPHEAGAIRAVGRDGEQALVNAVLAVFLEGLVHLRCFIHMKDNICRKLIPRIGQKSYFTRYFWHSTGRNVYQWSG